MVEQSKWIQEKMMVIFAYFNLVSLLMANNYDLIKTFSIDKVGHTVMWLNTDWDHPR
jgi:hypothetical protein